MKNLFGKTLEEVAIERMKTFEEQALNMHPDGYYLAYSGGKDSDVLLHIAKKSGVKFKAIHNLTTCDPPEVVYHVRTHSEVEISKPKTTMWKLIRKKQMPPRRNARYCCQELKERGGDGRIVLTGIRWGESSKRKNRRMFEACYRTSRKFYLHPIIDWFSADIWDYIKTEKIRYCGLYDEGQKRVGCVLCPMTRDIGRQMIRWPKIAAAWERAIKATYIPNKLSFKGLSSPEQYWQWWLNRDAHLDNGNEQCFMFDADD